ncbi:MAG: transposase [Caldilineaceae bacterium SB0666_bin_21]|nr:transposase [Caldilineaceae bacterium SB0666_bin_21]
MPRQPYPSDLTAVQWCRLQPWLPAPKTRGRPRTVSLREVVDAIRYVLRAGCAWRMLPHDFPCWRSTATFAHGVGPGSGPASTRPCGSGCDAVRDGTRRPVRPSSIVSRSRRRR